MPIARCGRRLCIGAKTRQDAGIGAFPDVGLFFSFLDKGFDGLPNQFSVMRILDIERAVLTEHAPIVGIGDQMPSAEIGIGDADLLRILVAEGESVTARECGERTDGAVCCAVQYEGLAVAWRVVFVWEDCVDYGRAVVGLP